MLNGVEIMIKRLFKILFLGGLLGLIVGFFHLKDFINLKEYSDLQKYSQKYFGQLEDFNFMESFKQFAEEVKQTNRYEMAALHLAKKNRNLRAKISQLRYRMSELQAQNEFLEVKFKEATTPYLSSQPVDKKNDLVKLGTYKWKDQELLKIARKELRQKNNAKAAQYFYTLIKNYPESNLIDDAVLFQTGVTSFQSKIYYSWANDSLTRLINEFPRSKYYRGAKLWRALAYFEQGDKEKFYDTVEEFRLKYRNSPEWKVLRKHYEKTAKI